MGRLGDTPDPGRGVPLHPIFPIMPPEYALGANYGQKATPVQDCRTGVAFCCTLRVGYQVGFCVYYLEVVGGIAHHKLDINSGFTGRYYGPGDGGLAIRYLGLANVTTYRAGASQCFPLLLQLSCGVTGGKAAPGMNGRSRNPPCSWRDQRRSL